MTGDLRRALSLVSEHLSGTGIVLHLRRAYGDRGILAAFGDPVALAGTPGEEGGNANDPASWWESVHPGDRDRVEAALRLLPDVPAVTLDYRVHDAGGTERWLLEEVRVSPGGKGTMPALVGVVRDVTPERMLAGRVAALEEHLWKSQRLESLGALAGGIAHDFNNLLTAILSSAQLLRQEAQLSPEGRKDLQVVEDAASRGAALVRQILAFARRSRGPAEAVELGRIIEDFQGILGRTLGAQVSLSVRVEPELWRARGELAQLEQILLNLAVNARDAMPDGGSLEIEAANEDAAATVPVHDGALEPGSYVRLTVRDSGSGIPPDVRGRIFDPFFTTKGEARTGAGFGLATVLRIVRGHGGGIRVESEEGRGSAFHVYLPVRERAPTALPPAAAEWVAEPDFPAARILLVEDDPSVREIVERTLVRDGHAVVSVGTARDALQVFDRLRPAFDLLVSDVVLPDRSGPDLHRALRRRVGSLPALFMSGYGGEVLGGRGGLEPGARLLRKPFEPTALRREVARALREGRGPRNGPDSAKAGGVHG